MFSDEEILEIYSVQSWSRRYSNPSPTFCTQQGALGWREFLCRAPFGTTSLTRLTGTYVRYGTHRGIHIHGSEGRNRGFQSGERGKWGNGNHEDKDSVMRNEPTSRGLRGEALSSAQRWSICLVLRRRVLSRAPL